MLKLKNKILIVNFDGSLFYVYKKLAVTRFLIKKNLFSFYKHKNFKYIVTK